MNTSVQGLAPAIPLPPPGGVVGKPSAPVEGPSFQDFLANSLDQVNNLQRDADQAVEKMFTGGDANPAEVLTAVQKADMSFRLVMQVRNKLVAAYQELKEIRI